MLRVLRPFVAFGFLSSASCTLLFDTEPLDDGCSVDAKACGGVCVSTLDPGVGCGRATCGPCVLDHVEEAACGGDGDCAVAICEGAYANCDNDPINGCEVNLDTSNGNCGRCDRDCTELFPNKPRVTKTACADRNCVVDACEQGYWDCDNALANGCEIHLLTDEQHCGRCDDACGSGQTCDNGFCVP